MHTFYSVSSSTVSMLLNLETTAEKLKSKGSIEHCHYRQRSTGVSDSESISLSSILNAFLKSPVGGGGEGPGRREGRGN